jgi:predicted nucleic acid-binding protein
VNVTPSVCVVDASALVDSVLDPGGLGRSMRILLATSQTHAPHLLDAEVGSVLRRIVLRGELAADVAATRLGHAQALVDVRHRMDGRISSAAWTLREEITFYDAVYVSLASALGQPLVTSDGRLAAAARRHCDVLHLT